MSVNEGDEVTAGQGRCDHLVAGKMQAQLRAAQAQVLKAKHALAEAKATDRPAQQ